MNDIQSILKSRIMVLDGAMGTMIQRRGLSDADFRGERFASHPVVLAGCNDVLCLTRPDIIAAIHREYLEAGADIIETNSFNSNPISLREYGLGGFAREIAREAAAIARREADCFTAANPDWPRFVAGSMGPGNIALSVSSETTFDQLADAFMEQACGLIEGGADVLLLETIFDTLNAKAAIYGLEKAFDSCGKRLPVMLSATLSENGRLLSGQTPEAFLASVAHIRPLSVGFNCGFGPDKLVPFIERLAAVCPYYISLYPNAGLPDGCGHYHTTPEQLGEALKEALNAGWLNIIGGCCGTTPAHIATLAELARHGQPRPLPSRGDALELSGLESLAVERTFVKVGERCNVAGSRKFLRLIKEGNHAEALEIASAQITKGAGVIDVNMDDGLLDASTEMTRFVELLGADSTTAKVPVMVDSSDFKVLTSALRHIQGRPVVNSISLKNGEESFLSQAREIRRLGAAVVVMAFDEQGQADTFERRIEVCGRAYRLLTEKCGFSGNEIIFDPNILAVATGIDAHSRYALDFLEATAWIKANLPGARVSGGVSNLSFAFRGNNAVREAMHSVFLALAIERGLDMAIVNPSTKLTTDWIEPTLREAVEDVLLCRRAYATDRLVALAEEIKARAAEATPKKKIENAPAPESPSAILAHMVEHGLDFDAPALMPGVLEECGSAMNVINDVLMRAMDRVGVRFAAGDMFLPQVVRAAASMKRAVEWLTPVIEAEKSSGNQAASAGKFVLATVKGDVHDIGKNIVAVVLRCSGFEVIDLGVMVEAKDIVDTAQRENAAFVGLSGLITPSLAEMARVASEMESRGMNIPLFIGGATTSDMHAAVRVAPYYSGAVVHSGDAASLPAAAAAFAPGAAFEAAAEAAHKRNSDLLDSFTASQPILSLDEARQRAPEPCLPAPRPTSTGTFDLKFGIDHLVPLINWNAFLGEWGIDPAKAAEPESRRVVADAQATLASLKDVEVSARVTIEAAHRDGDDIVVDNLGIIVPVLRSQTANPVTGDTLALSDFVSSQADYVAFFAVTLAGAPIYELIDKANATGDDYRSLMLQILSHRLAEAATEALHRHVNSVLWPGTKGIRPAVGYPSLPDQSLVNEFDKILHYRSLGIKPTETGALWPSATTTGIIIANPRARYFSVGAIGADQLSDYARRRGLPPDDLKPFLASVIRE